MTHLERRSAGLAGRWEEREQIGFGSGNLESGRWAGERGSPAVCPGESYASMLKVLGKSWRSILRSSWGLVLGGDFAVRGVSPVPLLYLCLYYTRSMTAGDKSLTGSYGQRQFGDVWKNL